MTLPKIYIGSPSVVSAFGEDNDTWTALMNGQSGIGPITKFDAAGLNMPTRIASEIVVDYDYLADVTGIKPGTFTREFDDFVAHAMLASMNSLSNGNVYKHLLEDPLMAGITVGSGGSGLPSFEHLVEVTCDGYPQDRKVRLENMLRILKFLINMPTGQLSIHHQLRGPNETFGDACAAGSKAIIGAARAIALGEARLMLSGGTEGVINRTSLAAFNLMDPRGSTGGAMSMRNDDPTTASRPYQLGRDGFVPGEGAAFCVLTDTQTEASIAEVIGWASTGDAYSMFAPTPDGSGALATMKKALQMAGIGSAEVDVVISHGTSTPAGDASETQAMRQLFEGFANDVMVYTPKGALGHWLGASGPLGVWTALKAMETQQLPITHGLTEETLDPDCSGLGHLVRGEPIDIVLVNAFGFGGTNASLVLRKL